MDHPLFLRVAETEMLVSVIFVSKIVFFANKGDLWIKGGLSPIKGQLPHRINLPRLYLVSLPARVYAQAGWR
ncbi:MAG: hypothetical protein UW34_C0001G0020 [Parcubacteria group bacterium GW2011_GWA2_44_15]|nr:MAG: hypothetical protein UW34_C0001G0020 [Parcubacteria group bacterium GW2011_GWA2_44_15]